MVGFKAIFTNLINNFLPDAIIGHPQAKKIKAFWTRNLIHFHKPDSAQDILHLILKSVRSMSFQKGSNFLEKQLKQSDNNNHAKVHSVLKYPQLLFIFADLMTLPMFEQVKLVLYCVMLAGKLSPFCP